MEGLDQVGAPEGASTRVPFAVRLTSFGSSGMVKCSHTVLPVAASTATSLPRKVQHSYFGSAAGMTSSEETGTSSLPPTSAGVPVSVALGCSSIFRDHTNSPVSMFTA